MMGWLIFVTGNLLGDAISGLFPEIFKSNTSRRINKISYLLWSRPTFLHSLYIRKTFRMGYLRRTVKFVWCLLVCQPFWGPSS
jgi:hypothetical protein